MTCLMDGKRAAAGSDAASPIASVSSGPSSSCKSSDGAIADNSASTGTILYTEVDSAWHVGNYPVVCSFPGYA